MNEIKLQAKIEAFKLAQEIMSTPEIRIIIPIANEIYEWLIKDL